MMWDRERGQRVTYGQFKGVNRNIMLINGQFFLDINSTLINYIRHTIIIIIVIIL